MKILLCVDNDSLYEELLATLGGTLAVGSGDEVLVTHVVATLRWLPLKGSGAGWAGTEREILQRVDDFLERTVDLVAGTGAHAEALRLEGDVASEILRAADVHDVDLVVCGAIGQARSQDFLVGSVAEKLVAVCERDLLLARTSPSGATNASGPSGPSGALRVTVAIDDTDASYRAIESFASECQTDRAAIEIVHVMQVPPPRFDAAPEGSETESAVPPIARERADHAVSRAEELFTARGLKPRLALRRGDPASEILEAARAFDANLIVVGRGERKTGTRLAGWRGTVTKRVAQHAPCSVFVAATDPQQTTRQPEEAEGEHERQSR